MINRIQFQDISNSYNVDAEYTRCFDWDGGESATASEVGILSQESRTVKFKLIKDSFLQSLIDNTDLILYYKIVIYNLDDTVEFVGLFESSGSISIDKDSLMVEIEVVDFMSQIKNGGEFPNDGNEALSTSQTTYIGILSGLKDRLALLSVINEAYATIPTAKYFYNLNLELISLEFVVMKSYMSAALGIKARVRRADGVEYLYRTPINAEPYMYFITDENIKETSQNFVIGAYNPDLGWSYSLLRWIDLDSITDVITVGQEDNIQFQTVRIYTYDWKSDINNIPYSPILGEDVQYKQTYSAVKTGIVTISNLSARFYLDYDRDEDFFGDDLFIYWVYPTESAYPVVRKIYNPIEGAYTATDIYPDGSNEFLFWTRSRTKDYQQSVWIDWSETDDYTEVVIHYLVKMWGVGLTDTNYSDFDDHKANGYSYRKRVLRYNGFQLIYDNFSESMLPNASDRAILYNTCLSIYKNLILSKEAEPYGNYFLGDHKTQISSLWGLSNRFSELSSLPYELNSCKFYIVNSGDGPAATGTYHISGSPYKFTDSKGNLYKLSFGGSWDNSGSGLNAPSWPYYENICTTAVTYLGAINLDSYIYSNPFDISDAVKLSMVSNLFAIISNSANRSIDIVNKVPIESSISLSSNDIIDLKENLVEQDSFGDSIYDVLAFENKDVLNGIITEFINKTLSFMKKEVTFDYSIINFGSAKNLLKIGDNFDYEGTRYSVCSVKLLNDYIQEIRAIKNGESNLHLLIGSTLSDAKLLIGGTEYNWNVRSI